MIVYDRPKNNINYIISNLRLRNQFLTEYSVLVDLSTFSGTDEEVVASSGRIDAVDLGGRTDKETVGSGGKTDEGAGTTSSFGDGSAASISIG